MATTMMKMRTPITEANDSIVSLFDSVCLAYGDLDAIVFRSSSICYFELQEYSKDVACQLLYRFRPSYVLVDCLGHVAAETVALLACMRIGIEFVPISSQDQYAGGRLNVVVDELRRSKKPNNYYHQRDHSNVNVVAIVCCEDDQDPILGVFAQANVHQILFIDKTGNLRERLNVPAGDAYLPTTELLPPNDNLYVLFTSGTSSNTPKAVVGSHQSTLRRLEWFRRTFEPSRRVGRRTRLTFVDSITELFQALLFPPSVLVAVEPDTLQSEGIGSFLDLGCTQLTLLPSQLSQLLMLPPDRLGTNTSSLERVIVSGEPCPPALLDKFRTAFGSATLVNLYGQTETTGDVLCAVLTDMGGGGAAATVVNHVVAVGTPIPPNIITVTSEGELIVKGNLSNCYLNDADGKRFEEFATGDVGFCRRGDGGDAVWYVQGRKDDVSKINGILTSPSEVEAAFCNLFDVDTAAATIIENQVYILVDKRVPSFTREHMKAEGLPWNLIPKQVIVCNAIPRQSTGAGKIDRRRVKEMVQDGIKGNAQPCENETRQDFDQLLASVLKISISQVDQTKSFVELGGDSASAVTFLYQLRSHKFLCKSVLTATCILHSDSIADLKKIMLSGETQAHKKRRTERHNHEFRSKATQRYSERHVAIPFAACVDAAPLVYKDTIIAACQGGVVQRVNFDGKVLGCRHLLGWMVQADLILVQEEKGEEALIVCAYTRENRGLVVSLSLDLQSVKWKLELEGFSIKTTPVLKDGFLWVSSGKCVYAVSIQTGKINGTVHKLPLTTATRPTIYANTFVYPSSEYDSGLILLGSDRSINVQLSYELGPVFKDPKTVGGTLFVCDSYGFINRVTLAAHADEDAKIERFQVSSKPLTSPCILLDSVVVGSYNSMVYCLDRAVDSKTVKWEFDAQAAIYSAPLATSDGSSVVVCTTAGDVIRLGALDGKLLWRGRVPSGEIWSNPIEVGCCDRVAFGARDSQLHIVTMRT